MTKLNVSFKDDKQEVVNVKQQLKLIGVAEIARRLGMAQPTAISRIKQSGIEPFAVVVQGTRKPQPVFTEEQVHSVKQIKL